MIYKIKSVHFFDTDSIYVSADYSNVVMQYLISYIQFKFYKFAPDYGLSPRQIGSILTNVYGFNDTEPNDESLIIDTFNIWEDYCMASDIILNIRMFQNAKLQDELVKQLHYIITE